jgi:hypothetical protein
MSALPPKADILHCGRDCFSITSSARSRIDVGIDTPIALAVFRLSANSKEREVLAAMTALTAAYSGPITHCPPGAARSCDSAALTPARRANK